MPARSKSQVRFLFAAEKRGEVKPGTAEEFVKGVNVKKLPNKVKSKRK